MGDTSLTFLLTAECNLRCRYCLQRRKQRARPDWDLLQATLRALLPAAGDLRVSFTGGEPLLAFESLKRIVLHIEETVRPPRRVRWGVITNGLLLDDERLRFFDSRHFDVILSFDGVPSAQAVRGRGTFRRLDQTLDRIRAFHPNLFHERLEINCVVSPDTVRHLAASVRYFLEQNIRRITLAPAIGQRGWRVERIAELEEQFERIFELSLRDYERTRRVPVRLFAKVRPDAGAVARGQRWMCQAASGTRFTVDVDGRAYGCTMAAGSYLARSPDIMLPALEALHVGRPTDPGFRQRVKGMKAAARACGAFQHAERRYSSYGECAECKYFRRCAACPLAPAAEREWDDVRRVPDFVCAFNRLALACRDRFPTQTGVYELITGPAPDTSSARPTHRPA